MRTRRPGAFVSSFAVSLLALGGLTAFGISRTSSGSQGQATSQTSQLSASSAQARVWSEEGLTGNVQLQGEVPLKVQHGAVAYVGHLPGNYVVKLNFGFPITNTAGINALIAQEAKTHSYISNSELYQRFSPPQAQYGALENWLRSQGLKVIHVGGDRLSIGVQGTTAQVEQTLHVTLNEYERAGYSFQGVKVAPYVFYSNTTNPTVPARFGLQTVTGLSDIDRFFTSAQLAQGAKSSSGCSNTDNAVIAPLCSDASDVRSGGYFPLDIRSLYDVAGHGYDGTGQTLGFTLWGAGERQPAMTAFSTATGDQLITVDPDCVATGTTPTTVGSCDSLQVAGDHLVTILENGNTANADNNYNSNVETALDIEQAHGIATHAGMKYYDADCNSAPANGSGLTNAGCNGSDTGLEDAIEDAANDPTLHSVSNSWGYGGDPEWGVSDPFTVASQNSLMIGAARGTTFYFSTGDSGTYQSGYPADSPYVVSVGGTTLFNTSTSATGSLSTETTWAAGGAWCSNIFPRPSWQTGAGVTANAPCPGRVAPDVSAIADTNSAVRFISTANNSGGTQSGSVGGTSVAAPEMNGLEAVLENFVASQTYPGATPAVGFEAPIIYQLGNGGHYSSYFRDVVCGNTASPSGGPDGEAAQSGWDAATGWGAPDWFHFATGYAMALGATNLSVPGSLSNNYNWGCAKTPTNGTYRALSFPSSSVGYAVGSAGSTGWYGKFLASGELAGESMILKTLDGGNTWFPSNADMTSVACTSTSNCVEVGDGGRIRVTSNSGATWTDVNSGFNKGLTQVTCPSSTVCYAAGDRGVVLKSTDGGNTWSYAGSTATGVAGSGATADGNPIYGLYCVSTSTCYATDIYAHVLKTTDGGNTWTWQTTPVTTPGVNVPGSGGPNPFGGLMGISCADSAGQNCVAVSLYASVTGQTAPTTVAPIVATTNGGSNWTLEASNAGSTGTAPNYLAAVSCIQGTTTCYAVGRGGAIVTTTDMVNWTKMTSNTTNALNDITCSSTTSCVATGASGTIDVLSGTTWTATTGNAGGGLIAGVSCPGTTTCYVVGKQGVTYATTNGTTWTQQAGGGTNQQTNSISCPTASTCFAVANTGAIIATTNGGQSWVTQTSGTTSNLTGISCTSATSCATVGAGGTVRYTTDGSTWNGGTSGTTQALSGVSCVGSNCTAVGAAGTIIASTDGGQTYAAQTSGTTTALNAVACSGSTCYADGAVSNGSAVLLKGSTGTWASEASNSAQALTGMACVDASNCFAGGAIGTVVTTSNAGGTWTQTGDPLSGPTSALNITSRSIFVFNGAACSATRCAMATGSSGDVMTSPLLTVTVHAVQTQVGAPNLTNIPASSLTFSPASEAPHVTGTLSCSTTATAQSTIGLFPISNCSGLADAGFSVVYDYTDSNYQVVFPTQNPVVSGNVPSTLAVSVGSTAPSLGAFVPGVAATYTATVGATITSTAATATLTAGDTSAVFPGHLVNTAASGGPYALASGLQVAGSDPGSTPGSGVFTDLSATNPATLLSYGGPVSNDPVTVTFKQAIGATDPLRTGTYTKTITLTLSTNTP